MRRPFFPALIATACLAALASCGTFGSDEATTTSDAGPPSSDAPSTREGGSAEGGGVDGNPPPSPMAFCASVKHTFCDDFDQDPLFGSWTGKPVDNGKAALSISKLFQSPPQSLLLATTGTGLGGAGPVATKNVTSSLATSASVRMGLSIALDQAAAGGRSTVARLTIVSSTQSFSMGLSIMGAQLEVEMIGTSGDAGAASSKAYGGAQVALGSTFQRVDLMLTLGTAPTIVEQVNGSTVKMIALNASPLTFKPPSGVTDATLSLGLLEDDVGAMWMARFDDVTVDLP